MSISSLLKILRSEWKIVSDQSAARTLANIITQTGYHIVFNYVFITEIKNYEQEEVLKCVVSYYIYVFPIVF